MNAEPKYTPGPWEVEWDEDCEPGSDIAIVVQGAPIAQVLGSDNFPCLDEEDSYLDAIHEECMATARLMAAAPELLAELDHLVRLLEPLERDGVLRVPGLATLNGARAALAKALKERPA